VAINVKCGKAWPLVTSFVELYQIKKAAAVVVIQD